MKVEDPTWPLFPILAFISLLLVLVPLPWHLGSMNIGTTMYIIWSGVTTLNLFVNSIVWHDSAINWAPIWCDISTRIIVGAAIGIPASALCIIRKLYLVASTQTVVVTAKQRKRTIIIDLCIALGFPLFCIFLQYVVEGHRFNIYGGFGCSPATYNSIPAIFLSYQWPLSISLVSLCYCLRTIYILKTSRARFYQTLATSKALSIGRYYRLLALAIVETLYVIIITCVVIFVNVKIGLHPWNSWYFVHVEFSRVELWPQLLWDTRSWLKTSIEMTRWTTISHGYLFFLWFGCAKEVRKTYSALFWSAASRLGFGNRVVDGREGRDTKLAEPSGFAMKKLTSKTWSARGLFSASGTSVAAGAESFVEVDGPKKEDNPFESTVSLPHTNTTKLAVVVTTETHTGPDSLPSPPPSYGSQNLRPDDRV